MAIALVGNKVDLKDEQRVKEKRGEREPQEMQANLMW